MMIESWSDPLPFDPDILEVSKVNSNLYQVTVTQIHIAEGDEYEYWQSTSDVYALFKDDQWVLMLSHNDIPN